MNAEPGYKTTYEQPQNRALLAAALTILAMFGNSRDSGNFLLPFTPESFQIAAKSIPFNGLP
jgi:hypothetical protein